MKSDRKSHIVLLSRAVALSLLLPALSAAQQSPQESALQAAPARQELKTARLWLPSSQSSLTNMLERAARQALLHPDCVDVLYGGLNEFRTERTGTSFTILCMKDARTTFNQVFYLEDLTTAEEAAASTASNPASELERLRSMMQSQSSRQPIEAVGDDNPSSAPVPAPENGSLAAPVVF